MQLSKEDTGTLTVSGLVLAKFSTEYSEPHTIVECCMGKSANGGRSRFKHHPAFATSRHPRAHVNSSGHPSTPRFPRAIQDDSRVCLVLSSPHLRQGQPPVVCIRHDRIHLASHTRREGGAPFCDSSLVALLSLILTDFARFTSKWMRPTILLEKWAFKIQKQRAC